MIRDIPPFDLGYVTNGAGDPVNDTAIAYSTHAGIERELELKGEGAIDLMPILVQALNSYDDMTAALREAEAQIVYLHEKFSGTGTGEAVLVRIRAALAKAEGLETSDA